jgi:putative ABC transport system permease protein
MRLTGLVLSELRHRWISSVLSLLAVVGAVGCLMASLILLREHRLTTASLLTMKETETRGRLDALTDDMRKITVRMGFNILILPKDQNLGDFFADDFASRTMPADYAERLAASGIATINHILPSLQQKIRWNERARTILLIGVRGEIPASSAAGGAGESGKAKKPLLPSLRKGEAMLGHDLHHALGLKVGDVITLNGRTFTVSECRPEKGSKDDISVWIPLAEAQDMLELPDRINAILALECNCATVDRLGEIRSDIARVLPDTQVIEYQSQALARAEARNRAESESSAALVAERTHRAQMESEKERLASLLVPLALVVAGLLIGLLSWQNVRERRYEIAVLRALGVGTATILSLVLSRAVAIGLLGSALGLALGYAGAGWCAATVSLATARADILTPTWIALALLAGPFLALVSAWLPALIAAQQDPANLLRED